MFLECEALSNTLNWVRGYDYRCYVYKKDWIFWKGKLPDFLEFLREKMENRETAEIINFKDDKKIIVKKDENYFKIQTIKG